MIILLIIAALIASIILIAKGLWKAFGIVLCAVILAVIIYVIFALLIVGTVTVLT